MKKILLVVLMCTFFLQKSYAQGAEILWDIYMDGVVADVAKTKSGYAFIINEIDGFDGRSVYSRLIFTDKEGEIIKNVHLGEDLLGGNRNAYQLFGEKGGYVVFGLDSEHYYHTSKRRENGIWIMWTDCNGYETSTKLIEFNHSQLFLKSVLPISDGYLITMKKRNHKGDWEGIIIKVNKFGEEQWRINLDGTFGADCLAIKEDENQNYLFLPQNRNDYSHNYNKSYFLKVNKEGVIINHLEVEEMRNAIFEITYVNNKSNKPIFAFKNKDNKTNIIELNEEGG